MRFFKTTANPSLTKQLIVYLGVSIGLVIVLSAIIAIKNARDSVFTLHDANMEKSAQLLLSFIHYELLEDGHEYEAAEDSNDDSGEQDSDDSLLEELSEIVDTIHQARSLSVNYRITIDTTTLFTAREIQQFPTCAVGFSTYEEYKDNDAEVYWRCYRKSQLLYGTKAVVNVELFEPMLKRFESIQSLILSVFSPIFLLPLFIAIALIWAVRSGVKRVVNLTQSVGARSAENLSHINRDGHPAELLPVIDSVNNLLDGMQKSIEREKQFTDDAAHELRTPLTSIKMLEQLIRREANDPSLDNLLNDLRESVDNSGALIDQLLELARLQNTQRLDSDTVILHELVQEQLGLLSPQLTAKNLSIEFQQTQSDVVIKANRQALLLVISNIIGNAVKFSPSNDTITITISASSLRIRDNGPGIPADEYEKIFERFFRGKSTGDRKGAGLGLALARRIAELHHFRLTAEAPSTGSGACFVLSFDGN